MRLCTVLVKDEELVSDLMYDRQKLLLTIATLYPGYTIQPVVKLVWQPVWQQVVSCKHGFSSPIDSNCT